MKTSAEIVRESDEATTRPQLGNQTFIIEFVASASPDSRDAVRRLTGAAKVRPEILRIVVQVHPARPRGDDEGGGEAVRPGP